MKGSGFSVFLVLAGPVIAFGIVCAVLGVTVASDWWAGALVCGVLVLVGLWGVAAGAVIDRWFHS